MEKEKVLEALKTIKEICKEHESCATCPLRGSDDSYIECMLRNKDEVPCNWDINFGDKPWRAFYN